jgi:hypothetical protein
MAIDFNQTSSPYNGLIQECERAIFGADYGTISGNAKKLATFTFYINEGLSKYTTIALESDTRWQFHDSNYASHPVGYTNLNANEAIQKDYELSVEHLKILHVYVKDSNGKYQPLTPIDEYDLAKNGLAPETFLSEAGMPKYYDKKGRSLFLYPSPLSSAVTESEGLQVAYASSPSYFTVGNTTTDPGLPIIFHLFPAIYACELYASRNQMEKKHKDLQQERMEMEMAIREFYNRRDKDEKPQLRVRKRNYV